MSDENESPGGEVQQTFYLVLAILSLATAAAHFAVMEEHFKEYYLFGWFFSIVAWLQGLWAIAIAYRPTRTLLAAALVGNLSVVTVWLVTRTVGIPIGHEAGAAEGAGAIDILSTILEVVIVAGCGYQLLRHRGAARSPRNALGRPRAALVGALIVLLVGSTTVAVAAGTSHGEGGHGGTEEGHDESPTEDGAEVLVPEGGHDEEVGHEEEGASHDEEAVDEVSEDHAPPYSKN